VDTNAKSMPGIHMENDMNPIDCLEWAMTCPNERPHRFHPAGECTCEFDSWAILRGEVNHLNECLKELHGVKFSDRVYHALRYRAHKAEARVKELEADAADDYNKSGMFFHDAEQLRRKVGDLEADREHLQRCVDFWKSEANRTKDSSDSISFLEKSYKDKS